MEIAADEIFNKIISAREFQLQNKLQNINEEITDYLRIRYLKID